jgi:SAM-dependent methyltransferase
VSKKDWDVERYEARHGYVWNFGRGVIDWLAPQAGEAILDLGCGSGQLTSEIAAAGATVIGIDSAPSMVAQSRINFPNLTFQLADATALRFDNQFDAVFSNAVLHWVRPPEAAAQGVAKALKPGGRFVCEFGGKGNVASILRVAGAHTPDWFYPSIAEYASILEANGLEVREAMLFDRPTPLEGADGMEDWLKMFVKTLTGDALKQAVEALRPTQWNGERWTVDYRRIRVKAVKL